MQTGVFEYAAAHILDPVYNGCIVKAVNERRYGQVVAELELLSEAHGYVITQRVTF